MMRRIALFSDVHGNLPALDAVLSDIGSAGISEIFCLGDLVGYGPDPGGVIDRIQREAIPTIRGNYDEGVGNRRGECGCYYATDQAKQDGAASYAFTEAALSDEQMSWLAGLPSEMRLDHDGVKVLLAHGSPRKINEYLLLDREDRQLIRLAEQANADVVCVGHVHIPYHRSMLSEAGRTIHYISAGSTGKPKDGDPRAGWVELLIGEEAAIRSIATLDGQAGPAGSTPSWVAAVTHRVPYDVDQVAMAMRTVGLPETLIEALRRG